MNLPLSPLDREAQDRAYAAEMERRADRDWNHLEALREAEDRYELGEELVRASDDHYVWQSDAELLRERQSEEEERAYERFMGWDR